MPKALNCSLPVLTYVALPRRPHLSIIIVNLYNAYNMINQIMIYSSKKNKQSISKQIMWIPTQEPFRQAFK